jgi:hypothetical protein
LTQRPGGQLLYELPTRHDGAPYRLLDPLELIEKLTVIQEPMRGASHVSAAG